jgi:hypothetical protein
MFFKFTNEKGQSLLETLFLMVLGFSLFFFFVQFILKELFFSFEWNSFSSFHENVSNRSCYWPDWWTIVQKKEDLCG